jgi:hypothetical protein
MEGEAKYKLKWGKGGGGDEGRVGNWAKAFAQASGTRRDF